MIRLSHIDKIKIIEIKMKYLTNQTLKNKVKSDLYNCNNRNINKLYKMIEQIKL